MTQANRPADYVRPQLSDARVERQWAALEAQGLPGAARASRGRARLFLLAPALLGCALAGAFAWSLYTRPARLPVGALVESVREPISVRLEDGSRLELAPDTRMQLLKNDVGAIDLDLREGRARFEVTHGRARDFKVRLGLAEVRVVGTRFELERKPQAQGTWVRVTVTEGVVELRRHDQEGDGEVRRLRAGESWSATFGAPSAAVAAGKPSEEPKAAADSPAEEPSEDEAQDGAGSALGDGKEPAAASATSRASTSHESSADAGASRVFRHASLARRAGRMRDAAEGYASLLARYPADARAGLSAFELGRIRMDALGDPAGAITALSRAVQAGDKTSFHEDALARLVIANDALGQAGACRAARDRYLALYPSGVHAHALAAQCK